MSLKHSLQKTARSWAWSPRRFSSSSVQVSNWNLPAFFKLPCSEFFWMRLQQLLLSGLRQHSGCQLTPNSAPRHASLPVRTSSETRTMIRYRNNRFASSWTQMTHRDKFRDRSCTYSLFKDTYLHLLYYTMSCTLLKSIFTGGWGRFSIFSDRSPSVKDKKIYFHRWYSEIHQYKPIFTDSVLTLTA